MTDAEVNDPGSQRFVRYMRAKKESDEASIFVHDHSGDIVSANATRTFNLTANANFYGIATSSAASAVHVPTPVYDRSMKT